ncbi:hypothetical protein [Pseudomonas entomophila]|uniref:hypothetical protein n=1 Tax=Pseudomonas entomophila TaxID=312306 RepID=UPI00200F0F1F|nr:hypothetical protein [Pseudomonas entomophila]
MTIYLVNEISHRLDGTTVVNCITQRSHRRLNLRLSAGSSDTAILVGSAYDCTWRFKLGIRNVTSVLPATIPDCFWPVLVSKSFYIPNLTLPKKLRSTLLGLSPPLQTQLLSSLSKRETTLFEGYLPEPYLSELAFHIAESQQRHLTLSAMLRAGISVRNSEAVFAVHGKESLQVIKDPMRLRQFQPLAPDSLHDGYRLIEWLERSAKCGSTIINELDIPPDLRHRIDWCKSQKLIIGGMGKVQLVTHAIQQRLLRQQIQRVSDGFFPRYAASEIDYAYSRYSGLMGTLDGQDFYEAVSTAINSRISYLSSSSLPSTLDFISELSAMIQLLGAQAPLIVVRSKEHTLRYSSLDSECKLISELPQIEDGYRSFIAPDFHHYSISDYHSLFTALTPKDRLVAISDLANATTHYPGSQVARQFSEYFQHADIPGSPGSAIKSINDTTPFDLLVAIEKLKANKRLAAICDDMGIAETINRFSVNMSEDVLLATPDRTYYKYDKAIIYPQISSGLSPFFCTLLSTSDKGIYADSPSGPKRISAQVLNESQTVTGFAMVPEVACTIGIKEVILVCRASNEDTLSKTLMSYGINIQSCLTYQNTEHSLKLSCSIQRIVPFVE